MAKNLNDSIQMEVKDAGVCTREFTFSVSADTAKSESAKVLNNIAGMVQLPGFRAGKAPLGMVSKKYAAEIVEELRSRYLSAAVSKIESDDSLDLLSLRINKMDEIKVNEACEFVFEAVVSPEFDLGDYSAIKLDIPVDAVTEDAVKERLDLYRNMYGTYADADTPAQKEDMLKVDYKGDFEVAEDAPASLKRQIEAADSFMWLNEPENIPGCIAALTGAEIGKEYTFAANYPADYREEALAGKSVNYTVKVNAIQRRKALTDEELIARTNSESMEKLTDNIRKSLEGDAEQKRRQDAVEAYYKKLDESIAQFDLPALLVDSEIQKALERLARETVKDEADAEKFKAELDNHRKAVEGDARAAVRRQLILRKAAIAEKVEVSDNELDFQLNMMSRYYGFNAKEMRTTLEKNGGIDELRSDLINGKVLEKLATAALN
ncbi:MAG: trigger factor [Lentisphaeria bacterium]|nr:trigger factor [Lentisphaeria bacterium]